MIGAKAYFGIWYPLKELSLILAAVCCGIGAIGKLTFRSIMSRRE